MIPLPYCSSLSLIHIYAVIAAQDGVAGVLYPAALLFRLVHFHHLSAVVIHPRWIRNTGGGLPGVFFRTGREYLSG